MNGRKLSPRETVAVLRALREARLERLKSEREFHRQLDVEMRKTRLLQRRFAVHRNNE